MNKEELAKMLDGREIGDEITKEESEQAKKYGLVVVYGASDDLMEFAGAIEDEFGTDAYIDKEGKVIEYCDEECKHYRKAIENANYFEGYYSNEGRWTFATKNPLPTATFNIFEDGELFCTGMVFNISDLK